MSKFKIIAIGVSTGGPKALIEVLSHLPADLNAAIVIVQHMSKGFMEGMVSTLQHHSPLKVSLGSKEQILEPGHVVLAPDDFHLEVDESKKVCLVKDKQNSVHVPSIDVMMKSVAKNFGKNSIAVILTGMGKDGVQGVKAVQEAGGYVIAQDKETSAIFGMNKLAIESGAVDEVLSIEDISQALVRRISL